jgi:uncharacterized protein YciI
MSDWLCLIRPPRPTFVDDMTDDEARVMGEHFEYLQSLMRDGRLLLAGPCLSVPPFGVIVLVADDEDDAWRLIRADPSVRAGVQTPEVHPFRASLVAGLRGA